MTITATSDNQILKSNIRNWAIGLQTFATGSLPRSGLVQRWLWNVDPTTNEPQSALMLAARITLAHFLVYVGTKSANSASEVAKTV